jgi:universal stress protein F
MTEKILVPVDLSDEPGSKLALDEAFKQARAHGSDVTVMTVVPDILAGIDWRYAIRGEMHGSEEFDMHKIVAEAEKRLEGIVREQIPKGMKARTLARHGPVYEEVLDVAEELGVDQIIMTAHRPTMGEYLLGTNAAKIVRHAKCSVNVLRQS